MGTFRGQVVGHFIGSYASDSEVEAFIRTTGWTPRTKVAGTTRSNALVDGLLYWNTTDSQLRIYVGGTWYGLGGTPADIHAPAIVVGNQPAGDTAADCDYLDTGNGAAITTALAAASAGQDVFIKAGVYDKGQPGGPARYVLPAGVRVRGAGEGCTIIQTDTALNADYTVFELYDNCKLEDLTIRLPEPQAEQEFNSWGAVELWGTAAECWRVTLDFVDGWPTVTGADVWMQAGFLARGNNPDNKLIDCKALNGPRLFYVLGATSMYAADIEDSQRAFISRFISDGFDQAIEIDNCDEFGIFECDCTNCQMDGVEVFITEGVLLGNRFQLNNNTSGRTAIVVRSTGSVIQNNRVESIGAPAGDIGIYLISFADNNVIIGNVGDGNFTGSAFVEITGTSDNNVVKYNNGRGNPYLDAGVGNLFADNL